MNILFITNILTPYRIALFDSLYSLLRNKKYHLCVAAMTNSLPYRQWNYTELKRNYTCLLKGINLFIRKNDFLFNFGIKRILYKNRPDIVVLAGSWTYPTILKVALLRKFYLDEKTKLFFWYESHDNASDDFKAKSLSNGLITKLKVKFLKQFDGFCVPGDLAKESVSKFVSDKPFIYLHNAVDGEYYRQANQMRENRSAIRSKYGINMDSAVIVIPARLIKLKGIDAMLSRISDEIISDFDFQFVLAGEGDMKEDITEIAKNKGINIHLLGYQQQENIRELLAASDFFCLPSLTDANPLSAIEAAWAGLPLLMSRYTGNYPELVKNGVNGMVFDPLDSESINDMLIRMLTTDANWKKTASVISTEIAEKQFAVDKIAASLLEQLKEVTNCGF